MKRTVLALGFILSGIFGGVLWAQWSFFSDPRQSLVYHLSPGWSHVTTTELHDGKILVVLYNTTNGDMTALRFEMPPCIENVNECEADRFSCCP